LERDPAKYAFLAKSTFTVDEVNDAQEFKNTQVCPSTCDVVATDRHTGIS
jgi:hypothetical protein